MFGSSITAWLARLREIEPKHATVARRPDVEKFAAASAAACGMFCTTMTGWPGNCLGRCLAKSRAPMS